MRDQYVAVIFSSPSTGFRKILTPSVIILYTIPTLREYEINTMNHKPIANLIPFVNNSLLLVVVLVVVVHWFAPMGLG
jgi:hypothetical protein